MPPSHEVPYTLIKVGDGTGGGMMKNPIPNAPSSFVPYVLVDDLAKVVEKAETLSATVMKPRTEVAGMGAFVIIRDPVGAILGLWEALNVAYGLTLRCAGPLIPGCWRRVCEPPRRFQT